ncbi:MAG TPA: DUF1572 family protein [Vicinamibacterales bacterium]|nr:DUF1572 family protein [Vicinamibacterales bacterium]
MHIYLTDIARTFRNYKALGDRALAQVSDDDLRALVDPDANSIAAIVKHVGGNLRSRFADFLTADGEKPDRDRDSEFEPPATASRDEILRWWASGWAVALESIDALGPDDLERSIRIRGETFLVMEALNRSAAHTAYHVGQIVFLAKHFAGRNWTSLSIPKNQSRNYAQGTFKQGIIPPEPR